MNPKDWLSLAKLAKQYRVPYQTARSAARTGHFRILIINVGPGGLWLAQRDDFAAWVATWQPKAVPDALL